MPMRKPEDIRKLEDHLVEYAGDDRIVTSHELAAQLADEPTMAQQTGIGSLDRILNGVEPGEMVIIDNNEIECIFLKVFVSQYKNFLILNIYCIAM